MKKVLTLIIAVLATISASAQFEQGKTYIGASLSGLDLSYNGINEAKFGINAQAGLFAADNLLAYAQAARHNATVHRHAPDIFRAPHTNVYGNQ